MGVDMTNEYDEARRRSHGDSANRAAAWADVHDPSIASARLAEIGGRYPEFAAAIVAHPNCYPELATWARDSGLLGSVPRQAEPATPRLPTRQEEPAGYPSASPSQRDLKAVLLVGLLGGIVFAVIVNVWYWLLNNPLEFLLPEYPDGMGLRALLSTGVLAVTITTHGLFIGLIVRKPGMILATLGLTLVTYFPTDWLLSPIVYPGYELPNLLDSLGSMLLYVGCGAMLVGVAGEAIRGFAAKLPDSILVRACIGLAVPLGWTLCFVVQLLSGRGGWPENFEPLDWVVWLIGITIAGLVFSGLVPAALSGRWIAFVTGVPSATSSSMASPAHAGPVSAAVSSASPGAASYAGPPGLDGLYEHPKATQVLMFALLGMFVFAPLAIAAWVTGAKAKAEIAQNPTYYRSSSSLQAGYVIGIVGTLVWAAGLLVLVILLGWLLTLR